MSKRRLPPRAKPKNAPGTAMTITTTTTNNRANPYPMLEKKTTIIARLGVSILSRIIDAANAPRNEMEARAANPAAVESRRNAAITNEVEARSKNG